jgi:hypothetical protein
VNCETNKAKCYKGEAMDRTHYKYLWYDPGENVPKDYTEKTVDEISMGELE